jgi:serine/threonine protein kinase
MTVNTAPDAPMIGDYELLEKIAEGGMGAVYKARHATTGQVVAMKVLLPAVAEQPVLMKRFEQEFRAVRSLDHPHIVRGLDFGRDGTSHYLVMELVEGQSLGERIERQGRLAEGEAVRIIVQVAEALHHAHQRGLVHRDVKPDNILITADGLAKLTDLGLSKNLAEDYSLTRPGAGLGTPYFMAPEQMADAKNVDVRCDVYGLGATLYLAVTGELPFRSRGFLGVLKKKASGDVTPPRRLVPALSERVDRAILRALRADRAERPGSCTEFIAELTDGGQRAQRARRGQTTHHDNAAPRRARSVSAERRATVRFPSQVEGVCLPVGGEKAVRWTATIQDISAGGIRLLVRRRFEPGTVLAVEPHGLRPSRPSRLLARVVRVEPQARRRWVIGCAFSHRLSDDEVQALQ